MSTCKNCGEEIVWCKTQSGKNIPVNPDDEFPVEEGEMFDRGAMSCHFDTCSEKEKSQNSGQNGFKTFEQVLRIPGVTAKHETEKGLLCVRKEEHWIAKKQIDARSEVKKKGDVGTLIISEWFAKTAGLIKE